MAKDRENAGAAKSAGAIRDEQVLNELMQQLPGGAQYVLLQRQDEHDPTIFAQCAKIPASSFDVDAVRDYYGGGKYRMQVVGERGKFISAKIEFDIDPRFKPTKGPLAVPTVVPAAGDVGGSRVEKLLETMLLLQLQRPMPAAAPAAAAPVTDPWEGALKIAGLLKDNSGDRLTTKDVLDLLLRGMELGGGKGGERSGFTALADASAPLFGALAKNIEADASAKEQRTQMRVIRGGAPDPNPPAAEPPSVGHWHDRIRPYLPQLVGLAKADKPEELYAELVLDQLGDDVYAEVKAEAEQQTKDQFVEHFFAAFPELIPYRGWCVNFFGAIYDSLRRPAEGDDPS